MEDKNKDLSISHEQLRKEINKRYEVNKINLWKFLFLFIGLFSFLYGMVNSQIIQLIGGAFLMIFAAILD